jgi:hypothetical protein
VELELFEEGVSGADVAGAGGGGEEEDALGHEGILIERLSHQGIESSRHHMSGERVDEGLYRELFIVAGGTLPERFCGLYHPEFSRTLIGIARLSAYEEIGLRCDRLAVCRIGWARG